jgi:hypothetical protein
MNEEGLKIIGELSKIAHSLTKKVILCIIAATLVNSASVIASVISVRTANNALESKLDLSGKSLTESVNRMEQSETDNYNEIMDRLEILGHKMDDMKRK